MGIIGIILIVGVVWFIYNTNLFASATKKQTMKDASSEMIMQKKHTMKAMYPFLIDAERLDRYYQNGGRKLSDEETNRYFSYPKYSYCNDNKNIFINGIKFPRKCLCGSETGENFSEITDMHDDYSFLNDWIYDYDVNDCVGTQFAAGIRDIFLERHKSVLETKKRIDENDIEEAKKYFFKYMTKELKDLYDDLNNTQYTYDEIKEKIDDFSIKTNIEYVKKYGEIRKAEEEKMCKDAVREFRSYDHFVVKKENDELYNQKIKDEKIMKEYNVNK